MIDRRLAIAPMMDVTDRHFRAFARRLTRRTLLYTEMITAQAVLRGDRARLLGFDAIEKPLALQLGGAEPASMAEAAAIGAALGYDEININVGCPSDRVTVGRFGACLMAEPETVAACVSAMRRAVPETVPVTVKTRLGIDRRDDFAFVADFVARVAEAGCTVFVVHARKAWLSGLSPRENREIPPLMPERVRALKAAFPHLTFVLNGGLRSLDDAAAALQARDGAALDGAAPDGAAPDGAAPDGAMIGRAAQDSLAVVMDADRRIFAAAPPALSREDAVRAHFPYMAEKLAAGVPLGRLARPLIGLFQGLPGGRLWRRHLAETMHRPGAGLGTIEDGLAIVAGAGAARRLAA
jgi:tRNA-dihydrouridine synthase A